MELHVIFTSFPVIDAFEIGEEISYLAKFVFSIRTPIFHFYPASQDIFSIPVIIAVLMQRIILFHKTQSLYLNIRSEYCELLSKEQALDTTPANSYGDVPPGDSRNNYKKNEIVSPTLKLVK